MANINNIILASVVCMHIVVVMVTGQQDDAQQALLCENSEELTITCPGQMIVAQTAFFGREDYNTTCSHDTAVGPDYCAADNALQIFTASCQGLESCRLDARADYYGDPCPGSNKYLKVTYTCADCVNVHEDEAQCQFWRLFGQCSIDSEWMGENCRKTCLQCDHTPPVCENVHDDDVQCTTWAATGECTRNAAWMHAYCRKACQHCDTLTDCSVNQYEAEFGSENCTLWYNDAQCTAYPGYMLWDCRQACFQCNDDDVIRCANKFDDAECEQWAGEDQCDANPGFMIPFCHKACTQCTDDPVCTNQLPDDDCETRATNGECETDARNMYTNCWKSCVRCTEQLACENAHGNDVDCDAWASLGECQLNSVYMMSECALSCTQCAPSVPQNKECDNIWSNDEDCNTWADDGECHRNPGWMISHCRESCTFCNMPTSPMLSLTLGKDPVKGQVNSFTRAKTIITPDSFSSPARLTHFIAYFSMVQPVYLEVWRPTGSNNFIIVYSDLIIPQQTDSVQTVLVESCVQVEAGDRIGFTNKLDNSSPLSAAFDFDNIGKTTAYRGATSEGSFLQIRYPYRFSLTAVYDPTNLCPDN